ncbi:flagellar biosynthesis protein FliQ [bacterium]|jgi:flagellar biosynthetic protein FliQ|nr:flagellar biosynthesis protein FliQ [bacterium]MDB2396589.1 flagellar biosynthesis protein FliQ [Planktomarina temperata]MDA9082962.1 flagellar biosynthesis protein FliQ [bacterium]MDA9331780.1 flagellar biosynthesis protein FliQ [bacterium]MDB2690583.1 flagellar biosynthesis protein FliQ [Planktomarina temperata]
MEADANIYDLTLAFWTIIMTGGPVLAIALAIGLSIGIIQAATSINEMTLSFVPKLIVVLLALALLSGYMMVELQDFFQYIFERIRDFGVQ